MTILLLGDNNMNPKIRTWHKQLKEFVPSFKHNIIDKDGNISSTEFVENTVFTGLLDKDGKEIYEGDNITAKYANSHVYDGVVVFDEGSFCLKIITEAKSNCRDYDVGSTPELNNFDSIEIIGNIYEGDKTLDRKIKEECLRSYIESIKNSWYAPTGYIFMTNINIINGKGTFKWCKHTENPDEYSYFQEILQEYREKYGDVQVVDIVFDMNGNEHRGSRISPYDFGDIYDTAVALYVPIKTWLNVPLER